MILGWLAFVSSLMINSLGSQKWRIEEEMTEKALTKKREGMNRAKMRDDEEMEKEE